MSKTVYHYVIVRADLPHGVQVAQTIHAAGESADGPMPSGTYAVALAVSNEDELRTLSIKLWEDQIPHKVIVETDGLFAGQAMTLGVWPTSERDKIKRHTKHLRLVK